MTDTQIHPLGNEPAPAAYTLAPASDLLLKGVFARFDGSGAAGSFRPLLRIVSDAGSVALETEADVTVAAGASADASWFPYIGAAAAAAATGISFDTDNEGGWLDITTNNDDGTFGMNLVDKSGAGIGMVMLSAPFPEVKLTPDGALLGASSASGAGDFSVAPGNGDDSVEVKGTGNAGVTVETTGTGNVIISSTGARGVTVQPSPTLKAGFFGAVPVAQQGTPVTLADVISLLRAYGLAA